MKASYLSITSLLAIMSAVLFHSVQEKLEVNQEKDQLSSRVETLEKRTELLEQILFSAVKLETSRAQRALDDRQDQLRNSKSLFAKGMITRFQLEQEQLRLQRAQVEFKLASSPANQRQLVSELELIESQRRLKAATEDLQYRRRLLQRGYTTQTEVAAVARWVDQATLALEQAKVKLEAAKEFDAIQNKERMEKPDANKITEPKK